jgi:hypothetical protein
MKKFFYLLLTATLFCFTATNAFAQEEERAALKSETAVENKSEKSELSEKPSFEKLKKEKFSADQESKEAVKDEPSKTSGNSECRLCRWIDLQTATVSFRWRWVKSNQRVTAAMIRTQPFLEQGKFIKVKQGQQQQIYEFDFKFDKAGRYKLHTRLSSGQWFTRSFAEIGAGDNFNGEKGWSVLPRQFYFSAEPIKGVEFQYGGLAINRGENSENTTYDADGFITGQRVSVKRPDKVWFDEVSVTYAFMGDFYKPNFFDRVKRLGKSNYHQFLVAKKFGNRVTVSVDYSSHATIGHLRQGVSIKTPEFKFIKSIKADFYQRIEDYRGVKKGWGYNFQAEMDFGGKLEMTAGFAKTDYRYNVLTYEKYPARQAQSAQPAGTLTGDRMIRGMSPFVQWKYKMNKYYAFFGYFTMDINKPTPLPFVYNADHFSVGMQFDVRNMLKKTGWL